jgi:hypothetical protein
VVASQVSPSYGKTATCLIRWPRAAYVASSSISVHTTATDDYSRHKGAHAPQQGNKQAAAPINASTAACAVLHKQQQTAAYSLLAPSWQPIVGVSKQNEKMEREVIPYISTGLAAGHHCNSAPNPPVQPVQCCVPRGTSVHALSELLAMHHACCYYTTVTSCTCCYGMLHATLTAAICYNHGWQLIWCAT